MLNLGVLVSGYGTNLDAIINSGLEVTIVIADRYCRAIEVAIKAGVPYRIIERPIGKDFNRTGFTRKVVQALQKTGVDVVASAGFKTILAPLMFEYYGGRILNTHPSLLPLFKGAYAVRDALEAGVRTTGCTVHLMTIQLDEGPILAQRRVPILENDTVETLRERIKIEERKLYPHVLRAFLVQLHEAAYW